MCRRKIHSSNIPLPAFITSPTGGILPLYARTAACTRLSEIFPHRQWLSRLSRFVGFTDIEFNPERSINCQARSIALLFSLKSKQILEEAMKSPEAFLQVLQEHEYETHPAKRNIQERFAC